MVSSITNNSYFNEAVSSLYTADSTANLVKTTLKTFFETNKSSDVNSAELVKNVLNYDNNDENSKKSIADALKNYASDTSEYIKSINANNDNTSTKSIADVLKSYANDTSDYIKNLSSNKKNNSIANNVKSFNQLTKSDYEKAGMSGYYEAQENLQLSKAITAYSLNNSNFAKNSTFKINVL